MPFLQNPKTVIPNSFAKSIAKEEGAETAKRIGILARKEMEKLFNKRIHLYTRVKIQENCLTNMNLLKSSGLNIDA